jgi:PII-like signaling protein
VKAIERAHRLEVIASESDRYEGRPLYEAIVAKVRELGLAGATVTRATMGFGASGRLHTAKVLSLSLDLPMVVDVVDREENLARLLPFLDQAMHGGLVTLQELKLARHRDAEVREHA